MAIKHFFTHCIMNSSLLYQIYQHPLINEDGLRQIVDAHEKIHLQKGAYVLQEGKTANSYLVLESGLIRSFAHNYNGEDITTDFFTAGELVIDVLSLFQRIPTQENVQALSDCVCWQIDFEKFQSLFNSITGFAEWGRLWMTGKLFHFKQRAIEIATHPTKERYLSLLKEKPEIIRQAPLKHIATYLGVTDSSLSRIRKEI